MEKNVSIKLITIIIIIIITLLDDTITKNSVVYIVVH